MDTTTPRQPRSDGGLYRLKTTSGARLDGLVDRLAGRGTSPDRVTAASLLAGAGLAAAVVCSVVLDGATAAAVGVLAVPLAVVRLATAVLDGQLARRTGVAGPRGAVLGELADRAGDTVMILALAVHAPVVAVAAAVTCLLADSVAVTRWAATGERVFPAVGGKPDRTVLVAAVALLSPWVGLAGPVGVWLLFGLAGWNLAARLRHSLVEVER